MPSLITEVIVTVVVVPMCMIGLFGNFSLLWATVTNKHLHHKICYIMAVIASLHVICLLNELYLEARQLRFHAVLRPECFRHTCVYMFAIMAQLLMFLMMAADYLLAVAIPLRHHTFRTLPYVFCICVPPLLFGLTVVSFCVIFMDDDEIDFCTPILAMPRKLGWLMIDVMNILNIFVLLVLLCVVVLVKIAKRRRKRTLGSPRPSIKSRSSTKGEMKLMQSFIVLIVIFVCSWCTAGVIAFIGIEFLREELSLIFQTYAVILVLPSYCQCYFVSYIRSPRHRSAYRSQQRVLFPCLFSAKRRESTPISSVRIRNSAL